ncbi:hypothetical protein D3C80_801290 [compost metagenome]
MPEEADDEQQRHHADDQLEDPLAELGDLPQQGRLGFVHRGDHAVDLAKLGGSAGLDHHALGVAGADTGAGEGQVAAVGQLCLVVQRFGVLGNGERLTGEHRLLDLQLVHFEQAHIGGNLVARTQHHDIARHQFAGIDLQLLTAAHDAGRTAEHAAQGSQGFLGLVLLKEADRGIDQRHDDDHQGIGPVPHQCRGQRGRQQNIDEHIVEVPGKAQPDRLDSLGRQGIGTQAQQAGPGLLRGQARRAGVQVDHGLLCAFAVPRLCSATGGAARLRLQ